MPKNGFDIIYHIEYFRFMINRKYVRVKHMNES